MNVLSLQVFVSLMLVLGSVVLLLISVKLRDHEHADRLTLLPLEDDANATPPRNDNFFNDENDKGNRPSITSNTNP